MFFCVYSYIFSRWLWHPGLSISTYRNLSQNSLEIPGDKIMVHIVNKTCRHAFGFWLFGFGQSIVGAKCSDVYSQEYQPHQSIGQKIIVMSTIPPNKTKTKNKKLITYTEGESSCTENDIM